MAEGIIMEEDKVRQIIHYVYIVKCADNTLYTGWTTDLAGRIKAHNCGKGAKYTKGRGPVILCYSESFETMGEALKRERQIKKLNRAKKLKIINGLQEKTPIVI